MQIGFATDIHLDHPNLWTTDKAGIGRFIAENLEVLLVGGDISTGTHFERHFSAFCEGAGIPVYFVLGNHDFWDAPEATVRETAGKFPGYLDQAGVVELTPCLGLVGRSGWYDTLSGNPLTSRIRVNDWVSIPRLQGLWADKYLLQKACRQWSEEEAEKARVDLVKAAKEYPTVIFITHFPCFTATCWNEHGRLDTGESGWWPWSINTTLGQTILDVVAEHPQTDFTILSGHTHGGGRKQLRSNLTCISGKAVYGTPRLAAAWQFA